MNTNQPYYVDEDYHMAQGGVIRYGQAGKVYEPYQQSNQDNIYTGYMLIVSVILITIFAIASYLVLM